MATSSAILDFVENKLSQPVELQPKPDPATRSVTKGILAGLIGGIIATAAKTLAEKIYPPRTQGQTPPPEVLAEKIAGHPLDESSKAIASETIHWVFGAATGAAYGALAEFYPAATSREGATFGMTLMALTHEGALPAMGLAAEPAEQTTREKSSEMVTHVIFGVVTETVRRAVREAL
jgi:putative membrane protein